MKLTTLALAAAALIPAAVLASAPAQGITSAAYQDARYISCVAADGLYNNGGTDTAASFGRAVAYDISQGVAPADEASWVYLHTPVAITRSDANVLVNCATEVFLGFGPDSRWVG